MLFGPFVCNPRFIGAFSVQGRAVVGHTMQLQSQGTRLVEPEGLEVRQGEVPAEIAMELPVVGIAGVAILG